MTVRVVTDSTADLPPDLVRELGITVVPLSVRFGQESFLDGVELSSDAFFQRLAAAKELPSTSQPAPGVFFDVYRRLVDSGNQVVSVHISSKLSGTMNSALQGKEKLDGGQVEVLDSLQATLGLGLVATAAAKAAKGGASLAEVMAVAQLAIGEVQLFGVLDTLEYLQRGGRIGRVKALLGSILKVRPIITVREGMPESAGMARSRAQGIEFLLTVARERAPLKQAAVIYSTTPQEADQLAEQVKPFVQDGLVIKSRFGPVLGTYVGPGAWGLAVQSEKKDSLA
ncbi:MAG: DegV family protein [Chloroflexi bacterium]|nr:DegV family protein [Chloroflexota bacterium]